MSVRWRSRGSVDSGTPTLLLCAARCTSSRTGILPRPFLRRKIHCYLIMTTVTRTRKTLMARAGAVGADAVVVVGSLACMQRVPPR